MSALLGRNEALLRITSPWTTVAGSGRRAVALVRGAPGIGKSALIAACVERARDAGWTCLVGGISAAETPLSWAGLATLVRQLPDAILDRLAPAQHTALLAAVTGTGAEDVDAHAVAAGLGAAVRLVAEARPVLVVLDDVQWLDRASAGACSFALRDWVDSAVAVLIAERDDVTVPVIDVDRIATPDEVVHVALEGLALDQIGTLLTTEAGVQLGRVDLLRVQTATGGNPLHVLETGRLLAGGFDLEHALLPSSLQAVIAEGLRAIPDEHLHVLRCAALLASPRIEVLERVVDPAAVEAALVAGERADAVRIDGTAVRFRHPLLPAVLVDQLGVLERRSIERRLAAVLDDPEERAVHLAAAAVLTDEEAAAAMEDAADAAARRGATHLAVERAVRSVQLTDRADTVALARRLRTVGSWSISAGELGRAAQAYREALDLSTLPEDRAVALRGLVVAVANSDGFDAARPLAVELVEATRGLPDLHLPSVTILVRLHQFVDLRAAEQVAAEALASAGPEADPQQLVELEVLLATTRFMRSEPVDLDALVARLAELAGDTDHLWARSALGELFVWSDRTDEADAMHLRQLAVADAEGELVSAMNPLTQLADSALRAGRWTDFDQRMDRWIALTRTIGHATTYRIHPDAAYLAAIRGDVTGAGRDLERELATIDAPLPLDEAHLRARAGFVSLLAGDAPGAVAHLERARALLMSVGLRDLGALAWWSDLVEALVADGQLDAANDVATSMRVAASRAGRPRGRIEVGRALAFVHAARGSLDAAEDAVLDALAAHELVALPFEHARTLLLAGTVARRRGQRTVARERLQQALDGFVALGAPPYVRRAESELARVGGRVTRPDELTETEAQVARLVAGGRTNAEVAAELFVSVRTVESNLTRLYRKLGVRSRTELARRFDADGTLDPHDRTSR